MKFRRSVILAFATVWSACTSNAPSTTTGPNVTTSAAVTGGVIVWGKQLDMVSTNIPKDGSKQSYEIYRMLYEPLTQPTNDGGVAGELAQSWDVLSPTSYIFHLRQGVKFSNGRAFDSSDVVTSLDAYKQDSPNYSKLNIQTITAVDPLTVRFDLTKPFGAFPGALEIFFMMPGKEIRDGTFNRDKDLLGTGPFMVKDHVADVSWTFVKNPYYWRQGYPKVDEVDVKIIKDEAARLAALKSGTIDFAIFDSNDTPRLLQDAANTKVITQDTTDFYYLLLNSSGTGSKFADPRVRRAIALAMDRQGIVATALGGVGRPTGFPSVGFPDGCDVAAVNGGKQDLQQAKTLLQQAGAENLTFTMALAPSFGAVLAPQMAQVYQQDLAKIGVKVTITIVDGGTWIDQVYTKGQFDSTLNWFTGGADASVSLATPFASPTLGKYLPVDDQLASLMANAQAEQPGTARTNILKQFCQRELDDAGFLPIATKPTVIAYRTDHVNVVLVAVEGVQQTFRKIDEFTRVAH